MTTRLTMTPDSTDWAEDDLRWDAGYAGGLWKDFSDEDEAERTGKWLAGIGWTVTIRPVEDERAG